jgi:Tol biopolymer transport system component
MKHLPVVLLILLAASRAAGGDKPFTIADLYRIKSVSDPHISPDGKKIAFVVTESFLQEGKTNSEVYIMNTEGKEIRNLSYDPASDSHPRWSPDGTQLLFVSTRNNGPQVWLMRAEADAKPQQLTGFAPGVSDPEWSPDGKRIIFASDVFPECGADNGCNKEMDSSMTAGPIKAHMADRLLFRHWDSWKDGRRTHLFTVDLQTKVVTDLTPGDFDSPAWELGGVGFDVSPDGREVCFVSDRDSNEARSTNKDLWTVPTAGGGTRNITSAIKA